MKSSSPETASARARPASSVRVKLQDLSACKSWPARDDVARYFIRASSRFVPPRYTNFASLKLGGPMKPRALFEAQ